MAVDARAGGSRARLKDLAVAVVVAAVLAIGAAAFMRYTKHRSDNDKVASTLRQVKADAAPIRGPQWDRVRAASLLGGPGGVVDAFKHADRPNHVTYEADRITVEVRTGVGGSRGCITAGLGRDSATFATTRCSPSKD